MVNVDHGILPAATTELREELHLDDIWIGMLGSLVYLGLVLGSLCAMPIFAYCNPKFVIIVCLLLNTLSLYAFTQAERYYVLALSRFITGFFQVFFCIYFPVWVDIYGEGEKKTQWLSNLLLGVPLGIIIGYVMTALFSIYSHVSFAY